jgi:hypothetical protein
MEFKFLSQSEVDDLDDKALEAYHHELQKAGDALTATKLMVKHERDARSAQASLSPEARAKLKARTIRVHGETAKNKPGKD